MMNDIYSDGTYEAIVSRLGEVKAVNEREEEFVREGGIVQHSLCWEEYHTIGQRRFVVTVSEINGTESITELP